MIDTDILLDKMIDAVIKCIDAYKDSLRIYEICEGCKPKSNSSALE